MSDPIVVERVIAAPPSVVYSYLTEPAKWSRWQGVSVDLEPRRGGALAISMPNGAMASGQFVELVPDHRVVFTWGRAEHPGVPPGSYTVDSEQRVLGTGTLRRLTHHGLPAEEVTTHTEGWNRYLPRLGVAAEGGSPEPDSLTGGER